MNLFSNNWRLLCEINWPDFIPLLLKPMESFVSSECGTFHFIFEGFNICNKSPASFYYSRTCDGTERKSLKCMKGVGCQRSLSETHWVLNADWPALNQRCPESLWFMRTACESAMMNPPDCACAAQQYFILGCIIVPSCYSINSWMRSKAIVKEHLKKMKDYLKQHKQLFDLKITV